MSNIRQYPIFWESPNHQMETGTIQLLLLADDLMLVADKDAERNVKVISGNF